MDRIWRWALQGIDKHFTCKSEKTYFMNNVMVGIDIGGTKMLMLGMVNEQRIVKTVPTGIDFTVTNLAFALEEFLIECPETPSGIGVAVPGLINATGTIVACDVLPNFEGVNLKKQFPDFPVFIVHDVNAAFIEETSCLPKKNDAVVIMVGTGIGMRFMVNGKMVKGTDGWAGELGKLPIFTSEGVQTLDDVASGASIVSRLGGNIKRITEEIHSKDKVRKCIEEAGFALGLGLASVLNLLNPKILILGGGTLNFPGYYESALKSAEKHTLPDLWSGCTIRRTRESKLVAALGALRYARQNVVEREPDRKV